MKSGKVNFLLRNDVPATIIALTGAQFLVRPGGRSELGYVVNRGIGSMFVRSVVLLAALGTLAIGQTREEIAEEVRQHCVGLPFEMPAIDVPIFPSRQVTIVDYRAIADGVTLNTKAFADAVRDCAGRGGGTVVVPPGTWLTGPIKLESNINLHLKRGAVIQFSSNIDDYPFIAGFDGKSKKYIITPPIHAYRARNIAITGEGIIDGAGEVWRYVKKDKLTPRQWKDLVASRGVVSGDGKEWWPSKEAMKGKEYLEQVEKSGGKVTIEDYERTRELLRPDLADFVQCNGILLSGTTFQNSPKFHVRPIQSENVIIRNVHVRAPWYGQNTDGIDPTSSRNVIIYNSTVDVGDDGICLKPGTIASSQTPGPACENIVVADCVVYHAHGGFVIGSETYGGVHNVSVRNCVFMGTDVGIRFKSFRGNGGLVKNVFVDGIQMRAIETDAILFDMYYSGDAPDIEATKDLTVRMEEPITDRTPRLQNLAIRNIVCNGADRAIVVNGLPEMPVKDVVFENVSVSSKRGVFCADADGLTFNHCRFAPQSGPVITLIQSRNVTVEAGAFRMSDVFMRVVGEKSEGIKVVGIDFSDERKQIELGENVKSDAVKHE